MLLFAFCGWIPLLALYIYIYIYIGFFFLLESDYFGEEAKWTQRTGEANNLAK